MNSSVRDWCAERLRDAGIEITGPPEPLARRGRSRQFRMPTTAGLVYFKRSAAAFAHEAALTGLLATWSPGRVPDVLAVDAARGWMLTADFGASPAPGSPDEVVPAYLSMIPAFAGIQARAAGHPGELLRTGCPDHRAAVLPGRYEELIDDPAAWALPPGHPRELSRDERDGLRRLVPSVARACADLAACGIPETVVHADLWRGNFLPGEPRSGRPPLIFDWAESVVGHPFFSLEVMLADVRAAVPGDATAETRVCTAYLAEWTVGDTARAARLAAVPAAVSRAVLWRDATAGTGAFEGAVQEQLRALLDQAPPGQAERVRRSARVPAAPARRA